MQNETLDLFLMAAEEGDRHAQAAAAEILLQVGIDLELARHLFFRSAEAKSPNGLFGAGRCLIFGIGGPAESEKGLELLGAAASYGHFGALRLLIEGYGEGKHGIEPNPTMLTLLLANASLNSMPNVPALPTDWAFWSQVSSRALAEAMVKTGISAFWHGPSYTFMSAIAWGMDIRSPSFDFMARLAAERGCREAASIMAEKSEGATKEFWTVVANAKVSDEQAAGERYE